MEVLAEAAVCLAQDDLAQRMQLGTQAAVEAEVREVEQVQFAVEGGFDAVRALGDGCQPAQVGRKPMHDETGFGQWPGAEDRGPWRLQSF